MKGAERIIEDKDFHLTVGAVDRDNPKVFYIEGRTFVIPTYKDTTYNEVMSDLRRAFKAGLDNHICRYGGVDRNCITDFSTTSSGMAMGKKSSVSFHITLRQKGDVLSDMDSLADRVRQIAVSIADDLRQVITSNQFLMRKNRRSR